MNVLFISVIAVCLAAGCLAVPTKKPAAPVKPAAPAKPAAPVKPAAPAKPAAAPAAAKPELAEAEFPVPADHPIHKTGSTTVSKGNRLTGSQFNSNAKKLKEDTDDILKILKDIITEKRKKLEDANNKDTRAECYFDEKDLKVPQLSKYLDIPLELKQHYPLCFWGGMKTEKAIGYIENPVAEKGLDCIRLESTTFGHVLVNNFRKDMDLKKLKDFGWNTCHCHEPEFWGSGTEVGSIDEHTLEIKKMPLWKALWTLGSRIFAKQFTGDKVIAVFNSLENHREKAPYGNTFKNIELPVMQQFKATNKAALAELVVHIVNEESVEAATPAPNNSCEQKDPVRAKASEAPHVYTSCQDPKLKEGLKKIMDGLQIKDEKKLKCIYTDISKPAKH